MRIFAILRLSAALSRMRSRIVDRSTLPRFIVFPANILELSPHITKHTGITWLAIEGVDPYEICRYAGITMEVFEAVYAHHHPDFMTEVHRGFSRHRKASAGPAP